MLKSAIAFASQYNEAKDEDDPGIATGVEGGRRGVLQGVPVVGGRWGGGAPSEPQAPPIRDEATTIGCETSLKLD